jgi:hypothetical protein
VPRGHSVRARLLILELSKGAINSDKLTECQKAAAEGCYARAMAGFVQWIAGHYDEVQKEFEQRQAEFRARALGNASHARTPEIVASLQAAFDIYLEFAEQSGAVESSERQILSARSWDALAEAAKAQIRHQAPSEPTERFISSLRSCLSSGRAYLASRSGAEPDQSPENCGWRRDSRDNNEWRPLGECVGWTEGPDIFLQPSAAYRIVQAAGRDTGDGVPVTEQTLRKRLREKGLLASIDEPRQTLTVRRKIGGSYQGVLHFLRTTILPESQDGEESDVG